MALARLMLYRKVGTKGFPYVLILMNIFKIILCVSLILSALPLPLQASENSSKDSERSPSIIQGYITNKFFNPIKLKVFNIEDQFFYYENKNLEDDSYVPKLNLKLTAENISDYSLMIGNSEIFLPQSTKLSGFISEVIPAKKFNKKGFFKVTFDQAICPDGKVIPLEDKIISQSVDMIYSPIQHAGKATIGLISGGVLGALLAYQLGGLGLSIVSHGYSLAAGAAVGGFLGTAGGLTNRGKEAGLEPGSELIITPIDEISLIQLKQISCKKVDVKEVVENKINEDVKVDILSVKRKKDVMGESVYKLNVKIVNNTSKDLRLDNFFLRDSQGKEYSNSFTDFNENLFDTFPPKQESTAKMEFFVEHIKAHHWLVLKDKSYGKEIGSWEINQLVK